MKSDDGSGLEDFRHSNQSVYCRVPRLLLELSLRYGRDLRYLGWIRPAGQSTAWSNGQTARARDWMYQINVPLRIATVLQPGDVRLAVTATGRGRQVAKHPVHCNATCVDGANAHRGMYTMLSAAAGHRMTCTAPATAPVACSRAVRMPITPYPAPA
jgi:hypothetical protein